MIAKIYFNIPNTMIPINNQHEMNSYIHRCLGKDNQYHDTFSNYSISSLQGGKFNGNGLVFNENPYIQVASNDMNFISKFVNGAQFGGHEVFDMKCIRVELCDFKVNDFYDKILTISPILLRDENDMKITFKNPQWIERLNDLCKKKLAHAGIVDETFKIELRQPEKAKVKVVWVGDTFNHSTMTSLFVYGKPKTRKTLYNLGLGGSTGSGFGSIKILSPR